MPRTSGRDRMTGYRRAAVIPILIATILLAPLTRAQEDKPDMSDDRSRTLYHEITVPATLDEVWQTWTTTEGINSFLSPNADIELKIGGMYEIYFDMSAEPGMRGAEGCRVLSYLPKEMLSYTWNAPPSIPNLRKNNVRTWVVMQFEDVGDGEVRIKHTMLGIGHGEDWDKYMSYFDRAWTSVLDACKQRFENGPIDWSKFE